MRDVTVKVPIRTVSEMNQREAWQARYRRKKAQQESVGWLLKPHRAPAPPADVFLTRIAPRKLDSDNLAASFKHVQDSVAAWLGIDDGDSRLVWHYAQRQGKPKEYAVVIEVMTDKAA